MDHKWGTVIPSKSGTSNKREISSAWTEELVEPLVEDVLEFSVVAGEEELLEFSVTVVSSVISSEIAFPWVSNIVLPWAIGSKVLNLLASAVS